LTYSVLAQSHILQAKLTKRQRVFAPRCHAALFSVIESHGLGFLDMSKEQMAAEAMKFIGFAGIAGFFLNALLQYVLEQMIPIVMQWLRDKLDHWADVNVQASCHGMFAEARAALPARKGSR